MAKFAEGETVQVHFTNGKVWTGTVSHVRPLGGRDRAEFALEVETARQPWGPSPEVPFSGGFVLPSGKVETARKL